MKLILASRSPERSSILTALGYPFSIEAADVDESPLAGESVERMVLRLARNKAQTIADKHHAIVIAADTLIECDAQALGQPRDEAEAKSMLNRYLLHAPIVWTATVLHYNHNIESDLSSAVLHTKKMSEEAWTSFWRQSLWQRRAGAFSIHDQPCPLEIVKGDLDVVRGINSKWLRDVLQAKITPLLSEGK